VARRLVATRAASELRPLNRRSCLRDGVTASTRGDHRSQGMGGGGGGDVLVSGRGTAATPLVGRRRSVLLGS
jgi:hypothetical protein